MGSQRKNYILASDSDDLGKTWNELRNTPLPNPNSGFDMIKLSDGSYLGVINNSFNERDNLTMVISHDHGNTWESIKVLENAQGKRYSYPSISRSARGFYHLTYTYEGQKIKHIVFNETWLNLLMGQSNGKIF
jgi:predicted neuraminidase